jgi:hypothetical protein
MYHTQSQHNKNQFQWLMYFLFNLVCQDFGPKLILRLKGGQMVSFKTIQPSSSANRPPTPRTSCCFGQKYHIPHKFGSSSCHMQDLEKNYLWNIPGCLTYSEEEPFWGRIGSHQIKTHWIVILVNFSYPPKNATIMSGLLWGVPGLTSSKVMCMVCFPPLMPM